MSLSESNVQNVTSQLNESDKRTTKSVSGEKLLNNLYSKIEIEKANRL